MDVPQGALITVVARTSHRFFLDVSRRLAGSASQFYCTQARYTHLHLIRHRPCGNTLASQVPTHHCNPMRLDPCKRCACDADVVWTCIVHSQAVLAILYLAPNTWPRCNSCPLPGPPLPVFLRKMRGAFRSTLLHIVLGADASALPRPFSAPGCAVDRGAKGRCAVDHGAGPARNATRFFGSTTSMLRGALW